MFTSLISLTTEETLGTLESAIGRLNPGAKLIRTQFGRVDPKEIMGTSSFDFDEASSSAKWF